MASSTDKDSFKMKMEKHPSEIEVTFYDSIPFWVLSKHRFFPMTCPHDHPRFKTDLNSLGKPTIFEILNTRAVLNITV